MIKYKVKLQTISDLEKEATKEKVYIAKLNTNRYE